MDELYGLHSNTTDYSVQGSMDNYLVNNNYTNNYQSFQTPVAGLADRVQVFGPDRLLSGSSSSAVSDAASMVAEIQRGGGGGRTSSDEEASGVIRAKISSHPLYPKLLQAYIDCQKVIKIQCFSLKKDSPFGWWEKKKRKVRKSCFY